MTVSQSKSKVLKPGDSPSSVTSSSDRNQANPLFTRPGEATDFPTTKLPARESLAETAYQIVHDEAMLEIGRAHV